MSAYTPRLPTHLGNESREDRAEVAGHHRAPAGRRTRRECKRKTAAFLVPPPPGPICLTISGCAAAAVNKLSAWKYRWECRTSRYNSYAFIRDGYHYDIATDVTQERRDLVDV